MHSLLTNVDFTVWIFGGSYFSLPAGGGGWIPPGRAPGLPPAPGPLRAALLPIRPPFFPAKTLHKMIIICNVLEEYKVCCEYSAAGIQIKGS